MLVVIDIMGTGETEITTSKDNKVQKKLRPTIDETYQPALQVVEISESRRRSKRRS